MGNNSDYLYGWGEGGGWEDQGGRKTIQCRFLFSLKILTIFNNKQVELKKKKNMGAQKMHKTIKPVY